MTGDDVDGKPLEIGQLESDELDVDITIFADKLVKRFM
jgi:hypothetical protein